MEKNRSRCVQSLAQLVALIIQLHRIISVLDTLSVRQKYFPDTIRHNGSLWEFSLAGHRASGQKTGNMRREPNTDCRGACHPGAPFT